MTRELQPCGTWAAYKRHLRSGEKACPACLQAARNQKNDRLAARREARAHAGITVDRSAPVVGFLRPVTNNDEQDLTLDPLVAALQDLRQIEAYMAATDVIPPQFISLSRRREELIDRVRAIRPKKDKVDPLDELALRRKNRGTNTAH